MASNILVSDEARHNRRYQVTDKIMGLVKAERLRQQEMFGDRSIAGPISIDKKIRILCEEVLEVIREVDLLEGADGSEILAATERLKVELIQVAACAVGWTESL